MYAFVARRMAGMFLLILGVNFAAFAYAHYGRYAQLENNPIFARREEIAPVFPAYREYIHGFLNGEPAQIPTAAGLTVLDLVDKAADASLGLLGIAFAISLSLGLLLGMSAAKTNPPRVSRWLIPIATTSLAMPGFYVGATLTAGLGFLGYYVGGEVWVWISDTTATRLRGMPELGQLLSGVNEDIYVSPWKLFAAGTLVFTTVLGFNLLGEGLRRFANSGSPSPRFFDLSLRLRWGFEEKINALRKWARTSPLAFGVSAFCVVVGIVFIVNQAPQLAQTQIQPSQSPGGHLWSSQFGAPAATMFVNAPGVESPRVEWAFSDAHGFSGGPAVAADGSVYILTKTGTLHAINPDGSIQWSASIPAGGVGAPGWTRMETSTSAICSAR